MYVKHAGAVVAMSSENVPKCHCQSGSTVTFQTLDCYGGNIRREQDLFHLVDYSEINPATGPIYVEGAEPGDVVEERTKIIRIEDGCAVFNDRIKLPVSPMVGVVGTAPAGEAVLNGTPGEHGSNMDCTKIKEGVSLYLPVNVPGALLAMGDLHAVMGDGEAATCAVEIGGEVTVRVGVLKGLTLPTPFLKTEKEYATIASAMTLDDAVAAACRKMSDFLAIATDLDACERVMLLSLAGDMEICQIVNPRKTARMAVPIWILDRYQFTLP